MRLRITLLLLSCMLFHQVHHAHAFTWSSAAEKTLEQMLDGSGKITSLTMNNRAAPALSPLGQGRIYFDTTSNTFKASENGGAYSTLVASVAGANPTSTIGNSIVNGSAATFMRSDGAPNIATTQALQLGSLGLGVAAPTVVGQQAHTETASTGTVAPLLLLTGGAHTALTASIERFDISLPAVTHQWATGPLTLQERVRLVGETLTAVGASTFTDSATLSVSPPIKSTNVTATNMHAIYVPVTAVSTATNSYGITVNAATGATNNYAAAFLGGNVGIATASPGALLHVAGSAIFGVQSTSLTGATVRGPNADATTNNVAGVTTTLSTGAASGTGNASSLAFQAATTRLATGATLQTPVTLFAVGQTMAAAIGLTGMVDFPAFIYTDRVTAAAGTIASTALHSVSAGTLAALNAINATDVANLYTAAPIQGVNVTATNLWGLWNQGKTRFDDDIKFNNTNTTAMVAALIGSTCPAVTCTAAYTWVRAISNDGSTVYFPVWK